MSLVHPQETVSERAIQAPEFSFDVPLPVTDDAVEAAAAGQPYSEGDVMDAVEKHQRSLHLGDGSTQVTSAMFHRGDTSHLAVDDSSAFFAIPPDFWEFETGRLDLSGNEVAALVRAYRETAAEYGVNVPAEREVFAVGYRFPIASMLSAGVDTAFITAETAERICIHDASLSEREATLFLVNQAYERRITERVGRVAFGVDADTVTRDLDAVQTKVEEYRGLIGDDAVSAVEAFLIMGQPY